MLLLLHTIIASRPTYECGNPCVVDTSMTYVFVSRKQTILTDAPFTVYMAQKFVNVTLDGVPVNYTTVEFDPFMQIIRYPVFKGVRKSLTIESTSLVRWSVAMDPDMSFEQWIRIPIDMVFLHGYYWSDRFNEWIIFIVMFLSASLFVSLKYGRQRWIIPSVLVYSAAAFWSTLGSKLYHTIVAAVDAQFVTYESIVVGLVVVGICFECLPILSCYVHFTFYKSRPIAVSILSLIVGVLFVSSGYYIGPLLLVLAALFTLCLRCR